MKNAVPARPAGLDETMIVQLPILDSAQCVRTPKIERQVGYVVISVYVSQ
jgi:hypothetical protein